LAFEVLDNLTLLQRW